MTTFFECRIADALGNHLTTVANFIDSVGGGGAALDYVLNVGQVGTLVLTVPATFDTNLFKVDGRIGIWRSIAGRPPTLDGDATYLIRRFEYRPDSTTVTAYHMNSLLARRIIAYAANSARTSKAAAAADDQIKAFVDENMGDGATTFAADRDGDNVQVDLVSTYLTIQANLSAAQSIAKAATRRNLAETIKELSDASTLAGTYLACEIVTPAGGIPEVRTYTTARGQDHSASSTVPVILSVQRGNLENVTLTLDYTEEATAIIAGGQGEAALRLIRYAEDTTRMAISPFGRIERFLDMTNINDAAQLQDEADAALRNARAVRTFMGDLIETPATTRGIHFDLGDIVTAEFRGQQFDCRLDVINVSVSGGKYTSRVQLRSVT